MEIGSCIYYCLWRGKETGWRGKETGWRESVTGALSVTKVIKMGAGETTKVGSGDLAPRLCKQHILVYERKS